MTPRRARVPTKRSKTFTGCWTCRDRGVKCDLEKPHCQRCRRAKRICQGYGIRLVWVDDSNPAPTQGTQRRLFNDAERLNPIFDETFLDDALLKLDAIEELCDRQIGPFNIFPLESKPLTAYDTGLEFGEDESTGVEVVDRDAVDETNLCSSVSLYHQRRDTDWSSPMNIQLQIPPALRPFLNAATAQERSLFHHWTSSLSSIFLPTPCLDNPFRTIYIPLALIFADASDSSPGHTSLLHCVYAIAAFHIAEQEPTRQDYALVAARHYEISLRYLRQSLTESRNEREAVLASIILMASINLVVGTSSSWRIHLRGGRQWLESQGSSWRRSGISSVLYQIFHCLELIGLSHDRRSTNSSGIERRHLPVASSEDAITSSSEYCLSKYFGIPEILFEVLQRMYQLRHELRPTTHQEISELEALIERGKPTSIVEDSGTLVDYLKERHAWVFYYACRINLEREFLQVPPSEVQGFVQACTHYLEEIYTVERTVKVCGITYPMFVAACEAEGEVLRTRLLKLFDKGEKLGIGSIKRAAEVVRHVWQHRDCTGLYSTRHRQEIMEAMGLDLLLA